MKLRTNKFTYLIAVMAAVFIIISSFVGSGAQIARAAVYESSPINYESQSVLDDLSGMTLNGKKFALSDYPADPENGHPQILSFVEYCYAYHADMQGYYGLYIYVYNPRQTMYDCTSGKNMLEMRVGSQDRFGKYPLKLLDCTLQAGYENRFYKFKLDLTEPEREDILSALNPDKREYEVSGIELLDPKGADYPNAHDYEVSLVYTFTGYASGYNEYGGSESTLHCSVDGTETVSLKAHHTTYRPKGSSNGEESVTRDSLSSVYFAVPKTLRGGYDDLAAVHAKWLEAFTSPMLVINNYEVYKTLRNYIGDYIGYTGGVSPLQYGFWAYWNEAAPSALETYGRLAYNSIYPTIQTAGSGVHWGIQHVEGNNGVSDLIFDAWSGTQRIVPQLNYIFRAPEYEDFSRYGVSSSEIYKWIYETYPELTGGKGKDYVYGKTFNPPDNAYFDPDSPLFNEDWYEGWKSLYETQGDSEEVQFVNALLNHGNGIYLPLFDSIADNYRDERITSDEEYSITSYEWSQKHFLWWEWTSSAATNPKTAKAIYEVTDEDFESEDKSVICDSLFISEKDYDEFVDFYKANSNNNRIYLFRFDKTEYSASKAHIVTSDNPVVGLEEVNAYVCKEKVYLDFDIIDITVVKDGVEYVIGVVMSPIDVIPGTDAPVIVKDSKKPIPLWVWFIVGLVALFVLGLICFLIKPIWNLISPVFAGIGKAFGAPFRFISRRAEERRERKEKLRQQKIARKEQMKLARYQDKLNRKERKRREKLNRKEEQQTQKLKDRQKKKAAKKRRKTAAKKKKVAAKSKKAKGGKK